jgi:carbohydrate diacid regulator
VVKFQGSSATPPYEIIQNLITDKVKDYVISISEQDIVIVKEVLPTVLTEELEKFAANLIKTVSTNYSAKMLVGISSVVDNLKDLARSFKEAQAALEVGKVFDTDKTIVSYDNLGIARLIYQLPTTLCETFLKEVFKMGSIESLDGETLFTIQRFFENNLYVSETSRKLFIHRNTLVYRLEKIKKITGLDLREFDHAIIFKIALMVNKYLKSNPIKY